MTLRDHEVARLRAAVGVDTFDFRFDIRGETASGGMSRVFEAIDRETEQRVAIKVILQHADRARFTAEAAILERLDHPAIVRYVRHGVTSRGEPYLAMEWLVGNTLGSRLARDVLSLAEACVLGERVAEALSHAHAAGIVHRDLKPSNIFLVGDALDAAKLIDFGVAKIADQDLTQTGQIVGTPGYMAPEQVRGEKRADHRVDLFALGCVLYEAIVGKRPFEGAEIMEVLAKLLLEQPPSVELLVPDVPPRISHLIAAMLAKDPDKRVASADIVRSELAAIRRALAANDRRALAELPRSVPTQSPAEAPTLPRASTAPLTQPAPPRRRRTWPIVLVASAALAAGAIVLVTQLRGHAPAMCDADHAAGCRERCTNADADACLRLATAHLSGSYGVTQDRSAAFHEFERACELGLVDACVQGADAIQRLGSDVPLADARRELELLATHACDLGDAEACTSLGSEYIPGVGKLAPDAARAYALLDGACDRRSVKACLYLRWMVDAEVGSNHDRAHADAILHGACRKHLAVPCTPMSGSLVHGGINGNGAPPPTSVAGAWKFP